MHPLSASKFGVIGPACCVIQVLAHEDKAMAYARRQIQEQHSLQHQVVPSAQPSAPRGPQSPQRARSPQPILSKGAVNAADLASLQAAAAQRLRSSISPGGQSQRAGSPGGDSTSTATVAGAMKGSSGSAGSGVSQPSGAKVLSPGGSIFQDLESDPRGMAGHGAWAVNRIEGKRLQAEGAPGSGYVQVQVLQTQSQVEDLARVLALEESQGLGQSRTVTSTSLPDPGSSGDLQAEAPSQDAGGWAPLKEATQLGRTLPSKRKRLRRQRLWGPCQQKARGEGRKEAWGPGRQRGVGPGQAEGVSPGQAESMGPEQAGTSPISAAASRWKGGARDLLAAAKREPEEPQLAGGGLGEGCRGREAAERGRRETGGARADITLPWGAATLGCTWRCL